jgi:hypothetical protein
MGIRANSEFAGELWKNTGESYWVARFAPSTIAAGLAYLPTAEEKVLVYTH